MQVVTGPRPNEGATIDLLPVSSISPDGTSGFVLAFNLGQAPVPSRKYAADFSGFLQRNGTNYILFGQDRVGTSTTLRSLLSIRITSRALHSFVKSLSTMGEGKDAMGPSLEVVLRNIKEKPEKPRDVVEEPQQTVAFDANIIAVAVSDEEACLDLYHTSAFSIAHAKSSRKIAVEPVVRVTIRTAQLYGLYLRLKDADEKIVQEIGAEA